MTRNPLIIVAAVALAACGGSSNSSSTGPLPDLDPAFGGTWNGMVTVTVPGVAPSSAPGQLMVATSGKTATITQVCPDGSGTVLATGSGDAAAWSGSLTCPPVAVSVCPAVTATLTSASATLGAGASTLTVLASGSASGCSYTSDVTLGFVGTR
jgi:hypothetical protein